MKKYNIMIWSAIVFIIFIASTQTVLYAQSLEGERTINIKMFDAKMNEYNCLDNNDCCISNETIEVDNSVHRGLINTKPVYVTDSILTEIPIIEVSSSMKLSDLKCWNTSSLVSKFCPICKS